MERELGDGWEVAATAPGERLGPGDLHGLRWRQAEVPGTVAAALPGAEAIDERDWWFRSRFAAPPSGGDEKVELELGGLATLAEVYLNGTLVLASESMFISHRLDVGHLLGDDNELAICCRSLRPSLERPRRPRARWRTRLVSDGNLRFHRTMLLGRMPGAAPGPPVVGPWRPVRLARRRGPQLHDVRLRARVAGGHGILTVEATIAPSRDGGATASLELTDGAGTWRAGVALTPCEGGVTRAAGELEVAEPQLWWPHTHGRPHRYRAALALESEAGEHRFELGRVGFRTLAFGADLDRDGIALEVNGVPVFARGAVWSPPSLARPHSTGPALTRRLQAAVEAGMNMVRVAGTGCYESDDFYDGCDELGILIWQDFMFARFDYPDQDHAFMALVEREAVELLQRLGGRPSLAVLCGSSEVAQQIAMVGLDAEMASGPLFGELLPSLVARSGVDAAYVPSTPWGGDFPFRPDVGVAHYYGVGAYRRPLEDARRAQVRFSAESLAFANVPDEAALDAGDPPPWRRGVPRDAGAGWDFADVRDHYLHALFGIDPVALRSADPERYLELSRAVTGEVMAEVFGEWRRSGSSCRGGLVLWLSDLQPGSGWGLLDDRGEPKAAFHHLRRALAPIAVWSTDEGLAGVDVHVANDRPERLSARLRLALYRGYEVLVDEVARDLELAAHSTFTIGAEELLGRFADIGWAYRFGPPAHDLIAVALEEGERLLSQSFRFPAGRPLRRETAPVLGMSARMTAMDQATATITLSSRRALYGVRINAPGFRAADDAFSLEPGHPREVELVAVSEPRGTATVTALNLIGRVSVEVS